ncbi:MAG: methionine--tRNA ligase [Ignavibacteriae bacterium]|nr:methionine--tRNA ligase [Ignavibacteriota bacterium]MCB9244441.1 methionine--tRNA ligase [Ignavibacteriales bacterium]
MSNKNKYIVTSALTYANGDTHLGHIAGSILPGDIFVKFKRLQGTDIIYVCGSDEYGTAIEMAAIRDNVSPKEIIDKYHTANKKAYEDLGMEFDIYSRTSTDVHRQTAQEYFLKFYNEGLLEQKTEKQLYSEKEQRFLADRFVEGTCPVCGYEEAQGDQCENCGSSLSPLELINPRSKISGDTPVVKESTHFYFPLGKYQGALEEWIDTKKGWKPNVINYCKGWFKKGLQERAYTRDLEWGVPVPIEGFDGKVIYVWFEAVIGYISATKELFIERGEPDKWKDYWTDPETKLVHFLGKDNVIFHAIIFPAMNIAYGNVVLPDNIPANEFLNVGGQKFSKSKGVGWMVKDVLKEIPPDVVRYAITAVMPENKDADFTWDDFRIRNNNELAAILGNFINRTVVFAKKHFDGNVPPRSGNADNVLLNEFAVHANSAGENYEKYRFKDALTDTMNAVRAANKYFNDSEPWKLVKDDKEKAADVINNCLEACYSTAVMIYPVLPFTSRKIMGILKQSTEGLTWDSIGKVNLKEGTEIGENEILFPQMEEEKTQEDESKDVKQSKDKGSQPAEGLITIQDFGKVKLNVGQIIECEKIEKSQKLLKIKVKVGDTEKQIVSGIAEHYKPEELIGKSIIVVNNLKPSKLMGVLSEGMLLAAKLDGKLTLVTVDKEIDSGAEVS